MARQKQKPQIIQMTVKQFEELFPDEEACCAYLVGKRWPEGVKCPRCGAEKPHKLTNKPWHWQCYQCAPESSYRFSHLTGTIFENTNKPLRDWFRVIHYMLTSKKGVSARQMHRVMGFGSYKTAWYMMHRVRAALANQEFEKLAGIVEVDETFIGGLAKNKHNDKRDHGGGRGPLASGKTIVAGAIRRKGNIVARVIQNVDASTLTSFIEEAVSHRVSLLCTDQWLGYKHLKKKFPQHATINHAAGLYVVGAIHTQTIEGFWSIFKRSIVGTFHKISKKYMPLYVAEAQFRYNHRMNQDIFGAAIEEC